MVFNIKHQKARFLGKWEITIICNFLLTYHNPSFEKREKNIYKQIIHGGIQTGLLLLQTLLLSLLPKSHPFYQLITKHFGIQTYTTCIVTEMFVTDHKEKSPCLITNNFVIN